MMMEGGKTAKQMPKVQPTKKTLELTLQELYTGNTIELTHERSRLCQSCGGKGGENVKKCNQCKGQGGTVKLVSVGPGLFTQTH